MNVQNVKSLTSVEKHRYNYIKIGREKTLYIKGEN